MGKNQYNFRYEPYIMRMVEENYKDDNCATKNEYISKAIEYYSGQLATQKNDQFISTKVASLLRSIVKYSQHNTEKIIFKLAVEIAMMMRLIARSQNVSKEDLAWLRHDCIKDIKATNGTLNFDDIYWWLRD